MATTTNLVKEITNKELQQILKQYPDEAPVILEGYQDKYLDPYSSPVSEVFYDKHNRIIQLFPTEDTLDQIPTN